MNNKGFAITTILFGITLLFCLLLISLLGTLSTYRSNLEKLVDGVNGKGGARNIVIMQKQEVNSTSNINKRGLYCVAGSETCNYYNSKGAISKSQ